MKVFPWVPLELTLLLAGLVLLGFPRQLLGERSRRAYHIANPERELRVFTLRLVGAMCLATAGLFAWACFLFILGRSDSSARVPQLLRPAALSASTTPSRTSGLRP